MSLLISGCGMTTEELEKCNKEFEESIADAEAICDLKPQTIEEFLTQGGEIKRFDSHTPTSRGNFMKKDKKLLALKNLRKKEGLSDDDVRKVDLAISERLRILKTVS